MTKEEKTENYIDISNRSETETLVGILIDHNYTVTIMPKKTYWADEITGYRITYEK